MKLVSFSGIDGAGKSTQIAALEAWLAEIGLNVQMLTFWDDVVVLSKFREFGSHVAFQGDKGVGSPEKPLERRDKNITSWPVSIVRFGLYFLDAVHLAWMTLKVRKSGKDVVIFDRYIYDELANLPLKSRLTRWFIALLLKFVPTPDVAYLIDADPVAAFARKPEYPLDFLHRNREAYLTMARITGAITVIEPQSVEAMAAKVRSVFLQNLSSVSPQISGLPAIP